jgi:hypothetical protein
VTVFHFGKQSDVQYLVLEPSVLQKSMARLLTRKWPDKYQTPANFCPFWRSVLNEVRRVADDSLSHYERKVDTEGPPVFALTKHASESQKKNDGIVDAF